MASEIDKINKTEKIISFIKVKRKLFFLLIIIAILALTSFFLIDQNNKRKNNEISTKYIKAGIYLANKEKEKSKTIFKEVVYTKHSFYSLLALNSIIENNLEKNIDENIKLFEIVENIKLEKEQKNLVKFKKVLYLKKNSREEKANKTFKEIPENSIWKNLATEILK